MAPASDGDDGRSAKNDGSRQNRYKARRRTLIPLLSPAELIQPAEERQVFKVIELAEAAAKAEESRRRSEILLAGTALMPAFGEDITHLMPCDEHRRLVSYIDTRPVALRAKLIVMKWTGRDIIELSTDSIAALLERARDLVEHAGEYLARKSDLAAHLRRGLGRLHGTD